MAALRVRFWSAFGRLALGLLIFGSQSPLNAARPDGKPNVIVIITDDQGYADAGFQGSTEIVTPHLDALAASGVVCTSGYVTSAVCAPSRAGLLTGRYQQRHGFHDNAWSPLVGLSTEVRTMADVLKSQGYATCAIGKWHLGQLPEFRPLVRGFTEHYGFLGGGRSFLPLGESQNVPFVPKDPMQTSLWRNESQVDDPAYLTDAFGEEAVACIERHQDDPFFLYLAFNAPHVPLQATDQYLARFPELKAGRRTYAAMLSAVDDAIGRISEALKSNDLEQDTLIFFLSDNGGQILSGGVNKPLRGEKSTLFEGGIRVPFIVKWPRMLPAGTKYEQAVSALDIMATAAVAAGMKDLTPLALDGVDLIPYLRGDRAGRPHEILHWRFIRHHAVRQGDWKLVRPSDGPGGLFDLSKDVSETTDLSAAHPDIVRKLEELHAAWEKQMPDPGPVPRPKPAAQKSPAT
jgi:arylsulfatase A-like enzyme